MARKRAVRAVTVFLICLYLLFNIGSIFIGMLVSGSYGKSECHYNEVNVTHFIIPGYHLGCWIME